MAKASEHAADEIRLAHWRRTLAAMVAVQVIMSMAFSFLQPILPTGPRRIGAANALSVDDAAQWKVMSPEMRRRVPKGVVDLSDALDGVDRPVYKDYVHVNEYGAKVLAAQMLKDLGPSIAAAQAAPPKD